MATQPRIELIFQNVEDRDSMFQSLKTDPHWQGKVKKGRSYIMRGKDRKRKRQDQNLISSQDLSTRNYSQTISSSTQPTKFDINFHNRFSLLEDESGSVTVSPVSSNSSRSLGDNYQDMERISRRNIASNKITVKLATVNVNGIGNKSPDIFNLMESATIHVLAIQETWLSSTNSFHLGNYKIIRKDKLIQCNRGEGV